MKNTLIMLIVILQVASLCFAENVPTNATTSPSTKPSELQATEYYAKALEYKKENWNVKEDGEAKKSNDKYLDYCQKALTLKPDYVEVYLDLSDFFINNSLGLSTTYNMPLSEISSKAFEYAQKASSYVKNDAHIYANMGKVYEFPFANQQNNPTAAQKAIYYYTKAIKLSPNEGKYYDRRMHAYYALKQYEHALTDSTLALDKAQNIEDKFSILENRGTIHRQLGNYSLSVETYCQALALPNLINELSSPMHVLIIDTYRNLFATCNYVIMSNDQKELLKIHTFISHEIDKQSKSKVIRPYDKIQMGSLAYIKYTLTGNDSFFTYAEDIFSNVIKTTPNDSKEYKIAAQLLHDIHEAEKK